jgi:hypothetical protein
MAFPQSRQQGPPYPDRKNRAKAPENAAPDFVTGPAHAPRVQDKIVTFLIFPSFLASAILILAISVA